MKRNKVDVNKELYGDKSAFLNEIMQDANDDVEIHSDFSENHLS